MPIKVERAPSIESMDATVEADQAHLGAGEPLEHHDDERALRRHEAETEFRESLQEKR